MRVLITGKNGQLGQELRRTLKKKWKCYAFDKDELDITLTQDIKSAITESKPDVLINTAAYTAVDRAEQERDLAFRVNCEGVRNLIKAVKRINARFIHISTDFVFSGNTSSPYLPDSKVDPISVYGKSKAEAEKIIIDEYPDNSVVLRTSWLYSAYGNNFVKTMIKLMKERESIKVVSDQIGTPTWARGLAETVWAFSAIGNTSGIYHWSDAGIASWYDFAVAIQEEALDKGLLSNAIEIVPIRTEEYPTAAKRPPYSVLDKQSTWDIIGYNSPHWRTALREMLTDYAS